jgi:hypothetical protein
MKKECKPNEHEWEHKVKKGLNQKNEHICKKCGLEANALWIKKK